MQNDTKGSGIFTQRLCSRKEEEFHSFIHSFIQQISEGLSRASVCAQSCVEQVGKAAGSCLYVGFHLMKGRVGSRQVVHKHVCF